MKLTEIYKKIISENSFNQIDYDDISDLIGKNNSLDSLKRYYAATIDVEDDEIDDDDPEFKSWIDEYASELFYELKDNIGSHINGNKIKLYRVMNVDDNILKKILLGNCELGIYWAYDEDKAQSYWGDGGDNEIKIEADVDLNSVNWEETFTVKIEIDQGDDETEVRLNKGSNLIVRSIISNGEPLVIKNNKYTA